MTKPNAKGGKKHKRGKKNTDSNSHDNFPTAGPDQMYAIVTKRPGGIYIDAKCSDDKERKVFIRGAFRKRQWLNVGDVILISCRADSHEDNKCDIICKYTYPQAKKLLASGEIKFELTNKTEDEDNDDVTFDDDQLDYENEEFKKDNFDRFAKDEKMKKRNIDRDNKIEKLDTVGEEKISTNKIILDTDSDSESKAIDFDSI